MSLGALSCEYVMDVWRVWHFLLLVLTLFVEEEAPASSVAAAAANVLKRRQSSAADQCRPNAGERVILRVMGGRSAPFVAD